MFNLISRTSSSLKNGKQSKTLLYLFIAKFFKFVYAASLVVLVGAKYPWPEFDIGNNIPTNLSSSSIGLNCVWFGSLVGIYYTFLADDFSSTFCKS